MFTSKKIAGIQRAYRTYISKEGKSGKASIIGYDNIDQVLITQISGILNIVLELRYKSWRIFAASICPDIIEETGRKTVKVDEILQFSKGFGTLIAIHSSSRSTVWHDSQTNSIGKTLEKIFNKQRSTHHEERKRHYRIPKSQRKSNMDLTIVNSRLLKNVND